MKAKPLIVRNLDVGDVSFDSDLGSWNVTRAIRDCAAGKHAAYPFDVAKVLLRNQAVEVDEAKVKAMVADIARLKDAPPLIFVVERSLAWLIDGHHRLRALARLHFKEGAAFLIEEEHADPYRVWFNGERIAPWRRR